MPRYFFAIEDGVYLPDEHGQMLKNDAAARHEAQMLYDELKEERRHVDPLRIRVTRDDGTIVKDGFSKDR